MFKEGRYEMKNTQTHFGIQRRIANLLNQVEELGDQEKFVDAAEKGGFALGYIEAQLHCGNLAPVQYRRLKERIMQAL